MTLSDWSHLFNAVLPPDMRADVTEVPEQLTSPDVCRTGGYWIVFFCNNKTNIYHNLLPL